MSTLSLSLPMPQTLTPDEVESTMDFSGVKAVVFDLDGTLVDSMDDFGAIASSVIHKYFGVARDEALVMYRQTSGLPFFRQLKKLFGNHENIAVASAEYEEAKLGGYHRAGFYHDVLRALPLLKQAGFKLCLSSNNHEENVVKKIGPHSVLFDVVLGFKDDFYKGSDHFLNICHRLGLTPKELVFVGDSLNDARLAYECGIRFVARLGTFHKADFDALGFETAKVKNFFELAQLLES